MKIYLDTCCYNRPYDDQKQAKIRNESGAIKNVITLTQQNGYSILGSEMLDCEINEITNPVKHEKVWNFYTSVINGRAIAQKTIFNHFEPIALQAGIEWEDARHLCLSISAMADYLLTVDDDFIDIATGLIIPVKVINPLNFPLGGMI